MQKTAKLTENYRLVIAILLSTILLIMWQTFIVPKQNKNSTQLEIKKKQATHTKQDIIDIGEQHAEYNRDTEITNGIAKNERVILNTPYLKGSINLIGGIIDDITLTKYKESVDDSSGNMILLSPNKDKNMYTASFGWTSKNEKLDLPTASTRWVADRKEIRPNEAVNLSWTNKYGTKFIMNISVDAEYMFTIHQTIENTRGLEINAHNYISIKRIMRKNTTKSGSNSQLIGVVRDSLKETSQDDLQDNKKINYEDKISWLGFSDKYWLVTAIKNPQDNALYDSTKARILYQPAHNETTTGLAQIDFLQDSFNMNKKDLTQSTTNYLFIGAKELYCLEQYSKQYKIPLFDRAIDFGMLYFITKPILMLLVYFYKIIGNFGLAILLLTIVVKIALFPLAYKGFKNMNRMKDLQPKINKLRMLHKGNALGLQKAIATMYKKEKITPLSGCLPILLQMPIFISLYKVLSITLEMRFAPFFGWIHDLSAADPTSIFNFFGLIHWSPPAFMMIGAMPILMGITMLIQQQLNPQPNDPTQAKLMKIMPLIITYMFATFPSGLVVYWAWSNILSILQQTIIRKIEERQHIATKDDKNKKLVNSKRNT